MVFAEPEFLVLPLVLQILEDEHTFLILPMVFSVGTCIEKDDWIYYWPICTLSSRDVFYLICASLAKDGRSFHSPET